VRGVESAGVGVGVEADARVGQVVEQVVAGVRQQDAERRQRPQAGLEALGAHAEQARHQSGEQRHGQYGGAGDDQPPRDPVELLDRHAGRRVRGAQGVGPGAAAAGGCLAQQPLPLHPEHATAPNGVTAR
jgi:hypothetical protein